MSFEETEEELKSNVSSLGFGLDGLIERKLLAIDYVAVERSEIEETGEYDLEGLFVRLQHAISSVGAKRVALDTIEALFSGLANTAILRAELRRLFRWLKAKRVTTLITGERGDGALTRQGIEEYVSDCVITLDHRVTDQLSTRRLRILKYRGSTHGTNEYPFLITHTGISVLPITSLSLNHAVSNERVSTGVPRLDTMLGGQGYYRGTTILLTGTAGTGKTSLSATFVDAACRRGERCLYLAFEESQDQIIRNMRSIGINLSPHVSRGLLKFHASRPTFYGLEMHLLVTHLLVEQHRPEIVIIDPVTNLVSGGSVGDVHAMAMRLVDYLKGRGITTVMTTLTSGGDHQQSEINISSLIDTWLLVRDIEGGGEHNRGLYILKSRGMAHSNQIREFRLSNQGIELLDVYLGPDGVLAGSARLVQERICRHWNPRKRHRANAAKPAGRRWGRAGVPIHRQQRRARARPRQIVEGMPMKKGGRSKPANSRPGLEESAFVGWDLRLYIAGRTPKCVAAFSNLQRLCEEHLAGQYKIEVIDLLENAQLAKGDQILAIPTLVRKLPEPIKKIIGDLSNTERVLVGLDLRPRS